MILELMASVVALAAPAEEAQAPPTTKSVAPLTVTAPPVTPQTPPAATVNVPVDDSPHAGAWASVWPEDAYKARIPGHVVLTCEIDRYGIAEWCKVAAETPAGKGFGAAALELRPTFKLTPRTGPDGPTDGLMNIAVEFKPPDPHYDFGGGRSGGPVGERAGADVGAFDITGMGVVLPRRSVSGTLLK